MPVEGPQGSQPARKRRSRAPGRLELGEVLLDLLPRRAGRILTEPRLEVVEVAPVALDRPRREPRARDGEKAVDGSARHVPSGSRLHPQRPAHARTAGPEAGGEEEDGRLQHAQHADGDGRVEPEAVGVQPAERVRLLEAPRLALEEQPVERLLERAVARGREDADDDRHGDREDGASRERDGHERTRRAEQAEEDGEDCDRRQGEQLKVVRARDGRADVFHVRHLASVERRLAARQPRLAQQHDALRRRLDRLEADQREPLPRRRAEAVAVVRDPAVLVDGSHVALVRDEPDAVDREDGRDGERHGDAQHEGGEPGDHDLGCARS